MAVSLTIAAIFLYPIICISCTYPPIKNYTYNGTMSNLVSGIQNYAYTNPHIILTITDTTGAEKDNPAIYFNVEISNLIRIFYTIWNAKGEALQLEKPRLK